MASRLSITVVAVGKLRERYWREAEAEYRKRLSGNTRKIAIVEVHDEAAPDDASPAQEAAIKKREADRLLAQIGDRDYVIALDRAGETLDSVALANRLEHLTAQGTASAFTFVIGGALGLHPSILERADLTLSFGAFTFPHQLMRIVLLEQLYRTVKIHRGEPYHR